MSACRTCSNNIEQLKDDMWLTQEQVKPICTPCYESMVRNNISKIKRSVLVEKINTKMKFYEITFIGDVNKRLNLGGTTLEPFVPVYFGIFDLPVSIEEIKQIKELEVKEVDLNEKPTVVEAKIAGAKIRGIKGVMWIGASPKRVNEYGSFIKNQPVFDLSEEAFNYLKDAAGFKVVG